MKSWFAFAIALLFVIGAVVGSYMTSQHMEETAMETGISAGGKTPEADLQQQENAAARGPSTTGSGSRDVRQGGSVPPATR